MKTETIGLATLYLGDCLQVLGTLTDVGAVVSDPPYGIAWRGRANAASSISSTGKRSRERLRGDGEPFDPSPFLFAEHVWFTGADHFHHRLIGGTFHVWDKRGEYQPNVQSDLDLLWSKKTGPKRIFRCVWRGLCRETENTEPFVHPTQKPIALMRWMVEQTDGVVLDPYMGSGTTGVACMQLKRSFVGIEIHEPFFDIACERIENAQRQERLFA